MFPPKLARSKAPRTTHAHGNLPSPSVFSHFLYRRCSTVSAAQTKPAPRADKADLSQHFEIAFVERLMLVERRSFLCFSRGMSCGTWRIDAEVVEVGKVEPRFLANVSVL